MPFNGSASRKIGYHRGVSGALTLSGGVTYPALVQVVVGGVLGLAGQVARVAAYSRSVSGVLAMTGDLTSAVSRLALSGILAVWKGAVTLKKNGVPVGIRGLFRSLFNGGLFK